MEFDHNNVRQVVEEDRLSSLPDEVIHMIMSCLDMKFVVQTCLLSSRWKLLWTSMPCLNFSSDSFRTLRKFAKFVTRVLSHRNHQIDVSSVKLDFHGAGIVRQIAEYAFSHNVQELYVVSLYSPSSHHDYPPCLFSSQSLKHFKLNYNYMTPRITTETPWDFPALTTLHLRAITLRDDNLFTNCVNLKNLTLERFYYTGPKVFDIITPQLSNLILIEGRFCTKINVIAPQLENLSIYRCSIDYLNAPLGISSLCYMGFHPQKFSKDGFLCLNKVSICLSLYSLDKAYQEVVACKTIKMLQEIYTARYLTLNADIVECLSLFPDLLSQYSSPFCNLNCLTIDYSKREDAQKVPMSSEVRNFLLENSPGATIIKKLPKVL